MLKVVNFVVVQSTATNPIRCLLLTYTRVKSELGAFLLHGQAQPGIDQKLQIKST